MVQLRKEYKHKGAKTIMKYDFTKIIDRQGKDAIAIDMVGKPGGFAPDGPKDGWDVIPMWIADMNFETVPTIQKQSLKEQNTHYMDISVQQKNILVPLSNGKKQEMV